MSAGRIRLEEFQTPVAESWVARLVELRGDRETIRMTLALSSPANPSAQDISNWIAAVAAREGDLFRAVVAENQIAGFVLAMPRENGTVEIGISLHPDQRRRGVGRQVLGDTIALARGVWPGCSIVARVRADNAGAQALFRGVGFAPFGGSIVATPFEERPVAVDHLRLTEQRL